MADEKEVKQEAPAARQEDKPKQKTPAEVQAEVFASEVAEKNRLAAKLNPNVGD